MAKGKRWPCQLVVMVSDDANRHITSRAENDALAKAEVVRDMIDTALIVEREAQRTGYSEAQLIEMMRKLKPVGA